MQDIIITSDQIDTLYNSVIPLLDPETLSNLALGLMELDALAANNEQKAHLIATVLKVHLEKGSTI